MSEEIRSDALFTVGDDVYVWDDVVRLAQIRGDWEALAAQVRAGKAALEELEGARPDDEELDVAARRFRYERDLLAADELDAWLERHQITSAEWEEYLQRVVACERIASRSADLGVDAIEAEVWCEGICSGRLQELARELAALAAVSPGRPIERLDPAFAEFCATAADPPSVAREVDLNRLEWLRFGYEAVVAEDDGAAYEAALCVRAEGESLAAVADRSGLAMEQDECWLDELDPALATRFLAVTAGEVVGPVQVDGAFVVARITSRTSPSVDDPEVLARARASVVARAVDRIVTERVVWG